MRYCYCLHARISKRPSPFVPATGFFFSSPPPLRTVSACPGAHDIFVWMIFRMIRSNIRRLSNPYELNPCKQNRTRPRSPRGYPPSRGWSWHRSVSRRSRFFVPRSRLLRSMIRRRRAFAPDNVQCTKIDFRTIPCLRLSIGRPEKKGGTLRLIGIVLRPHDHVLFAHVAGLDAPIRFCLPQHLNPGASWRLEYPFLVCATFQNIIVSSFLLNVLRAKRMPIILTIYHGFRTNLIWIHNIFKKN